MRTLTICFAIFLVWLLPTKAQQHKIDSTAVLNYDNCTGVWPDAWRKHEICTEFSVYAWADTVVLDTRSLLQNWETGSFTFSGSFKFVVPPPEELAFNLIIIDPNNDTVYNRLTFYPIVPGNWSYDLGFLDYVYTQENIQIVNPIAGEYIAKSIIKADQFTGNTATLNFSIDNPVPVELYSFISEVDGNNVILKWTTATEINTYGFAIERQAIGSSYKKIGFVPGSGNSNSPKCYEFTDNDVLPGNYFYRLKQIDNNGTNKYYGPVEVIIGPPLTFNLYQNYPNPFNPTTTISYSLPQFSQVKLIVYDLLGQEISILIDQQMTAGNHTITFDASNLPSGTYFYRLIAGNYIETKKMSVLK